MKKVTKAKFEVEKEAMIRGGASVEAVRNYIFNTFESALNRSINKTVLIDINGFLNLSCVFDRFQPTVCEDCYVFSDGDVDSSACSIKVDKWQIEDIHIDFDLFEQNITIFLLNDNEITIKIEN